MFEVYPYHKLAWISLKASVELDEMISRRAVDYSHIDNLADEAERILGNYSSEGDPRSFIDHGQGDVIGGVSYHSGREDIQTLREYADDIAFRTRLFISELRDIENANGEKLEGIRDSCLELGKVARRASDDQFDGFRSLAA